MLTTTAPNVDASLNSFVVMQRNALETLADTWLANGALWLSVCNLQDEVLLCWPDAACETCDETPGAILSAPLLAGHTMLGVLRAAVPENEIAHARRLQADAAMLSQLLACDDTMESMTVELVETQDRLLALYQLTHALHGQIGIDAIMETLVDKVVWLVGTTAAAIALHDGNRWWLVQHPQDATDPATLISLFQQNPEGETLLFCDLGPTYVLPLTLAGSTCAALLLIDKPGGFTSPDMKLARAIVDTASVHLENALRQQALLREAEIDAQLRLAAGIQSQLLPQHLPDVPGVSLFGGTQQARSVGGDFYDVDYHGTVLSFVVGDVTGKGFSSALMMAVTRTVLRSRAELKTEWVEAAPVFTRANQDLYDDYTRVNMFTTAFFARYDSASQLLCFSNAGHSPVIFCRPGERAQLLGADDMPLGIMPDTRYQETVIALEPGDVLVVATDGFNEARSAAGEFYGCPALLDLITEHAASGAQALGELLFEAVNRFSEGHPQDDDQTLFILRCDPA